MPRRETLPDGTERIHFDAPILFIDQPRGHVDFRPPTVGDYLQLGDPVTWIFGDGGHVRHVDRDLVATWGRKLIDGHDYDILARERSLALGMLIEAAILDFFHNARTALAPKSAPLPDAATLQPLTA